jgi:hypothetical protein
VEKSIMFALIFLLVVGAVRYLQITNEVITFYIENKNFDEPKLDIRVVLDDVVVVDDIFEAKSVNPDFSIYKRKVESGVHRLQVVSVSQNLRTMKTFEVKENKYVFISFVYTHEKERP